MRRALILIALPVLLAACVRKTRGSAYEPLRLCVVNNAEGYGNIIARAGETRFDVMPSQTVCKRITPTGPDVPLRAETMGGGAAGPIRYAMTLHPGFDRCWRWRLSSSVASQADLLPCEE